eukprot:1133739-Pelagomonas_calceolata.AAC.3
MLPVLGDETFSAKCRQCSDMKHFPPNAINAQKGTILLPMPSVLKHETFPPNAINAQKGTILLPMPAVLEHKTFSA